MTEEHEAEFLAGMGFDPTKFSPVDASGLGQVVGQTAFRPGWSYRPVGAARAGSGPAVRSAALFSTAACAQQGGVWNARLRRCTGIGMRGLAGDWDQAVKQVREYMRKQVQYRKEAENPELRRRRETCQRAGGTWHPVRRMCSAQGRHLIWTNGTFRGLGAADEPMDIGKIATLAIGAALVYALFFSRS